MKNPIRINLKFKRLQTSSPPSTKTSVPIVMPSLNYKTTRGPSGCFFFGNKKLHICFWNFILVFVELPTISPKVIFVGWIYGLSINGQHGQPLCSLWVGVRPAWFCRKLTLNLQKSPCHTATQCRFTGALQWQRPRGKFRRNRDCGKYLGAIMLTVLYPNVLYFDT